MGRDSKLRKNIGMMISGVSIQNDLIFAASSMPNDQIYIR